MSEPSAVEQEQQAPASREAATGPLLPRWFTILFYVVFTVFCIYSVIHISRSLTTQRRLRAATATLKGRLGAEPLAPETPQGREALKMLRRYPLESFLFLNQAILQDEERDERMGRAMALRRAVDWGRMSARRELIDKIGAHMSEAGQIDPDFTLSAQEQATLEELIAERDADTGMTYVEERITDVLAWVAEGHSGQPKGPEKRRIAALQKMYDKRVFVREEAKALENLAIEWQADPDPVRREAAAKFQVMLEGRPAELSAEGAALCAAEAERAEQQFRQGLIYVARASRRMAEKIVEEGVFLDHPHIYQYCSLLAHRFPQVRQEVAEGAWLLRHNKFCVRFLSYFATRTTINPFMAVETERLTREEHQRIMREANDRAMRAAARLLGRIGVDYIVHRDEYNLDVPDQDQFIRKFIVSALTEVQDEPVIAELVDEIMGDMRAADLARPGGPLFFGRASG